MTLTIPIPPLAPRQPHAITQHGQTRTDDYFWLRERDNPEVLAYLQAENAYTDVMLAHTQALQAQLFAEMKGRIKETDMSVPEKDGEYVYYGREEAGKQYSIRCRKRAQPEALEEMLLDENTLAEGHTYFRVGLFEVSPDHRWLAYTTDTDGDEVYTLHIKNLETGELLPERIPNVYYSAEWADDNRTLFYTVLDDAKRPYKVFRHIAGTGPTQDVEVFHEPDSQFFVNLGKSASKRYLIITLSAFDNGEAHFLRADQPDGAFACFHPRKHGVEYYLDHHVGEDGASGQFVIHTNEDALNFKLMVTPDVATDRAGWREFLPNRPDVYLEFKLLFKDYVVLFEREGGMRRIRITDANGANERNVDFPEPAYAVHPMGNREFEAHTLRFAYQSMITPWQVVDYDLRTGAWTVMKEQEIPSGYDRSQYRAERLEATAPDGKRVPISLAYKAGAPLDGSAPLLLYGYGSYGACTEPSFSTRALSLLDRGVIYAIAHVRGGAEMGRAWYEDGRLLHKKNTFTDFIACAEHLVAQRYTSPQRMAAWGASAGGLLIGAVANMRPDLFKAAIAEVPFVDVINTMSDATIPLTTGEWEQWGNPADKTYFDYMMSYSPYDNIEAKAYPNILAIAGLNDPRVQYWEPAKWVAKLRATKTDDNWLLLKTHMSEGHGGASGRYDALKEEAFNYAFLLDRLGVTLQPLSHRDVPP